MEWLLETIVVPAFGRALYEYHVPRIPGGAKRADPPVVSEKNDQMDGLMRHYEVKAHNGENWMAAEAESGGEGMVAVRSQIHSLAWQCMQEIVNESSNEHVSLFRDMEIVVLVPRVGHSVGTGFKGPASGGDFASALRESLSLYEHDLDLEFLDGVKVLFGGECDLAKPEGRTMTTSQR